jgi:uncharacterized protein YycO
MRGDILFEKAGGSLADRLIQWRTHGPFVHCEVDLGDGTAIGAHWRSGVSRHPVDYSNMVHYSLQTAPEGIESGIKWLLDRVGDPYGWSDILDQILTLLSPHSLVVSQQHGFDCSDLVVRYIEVAGGLELGSMFDTPNLVTPNDLARATHLIS